MDTELELTLSTYRNVPVVSMFMTTGGVLKATGLPMEVSDPSPLMANCTTAGVVATYRNLPLGVIAMAAGPGPAVNGAPGSAVSAPVVVLTVYPATPVVPSEI